MQRPRWHDALIVATPEDAYGANPQEGSGIPKNATLVFVVKLVNAR